jgi:hypothetical protein
MIAILNQNESNHVCGGAYNFSYDRGKALSEFSRNHPILLACILEAIFIAPLALVGGVSLASGFYPSHECDENECGCTYFGDCSSLNEKCWCV